MSVVVAYEETGPCRKKITIEVPATAVTAEIGRVVGDYRRRVRIPGFRKGKVPIRLLRQRFREEIEHEVADRLVPRYWKQAEAEKNLDPLLPPRFEKIEIEDGEPLTLVAEVETRPEIELGDVSDFQLPEERVEPLDEEVDDAIKELLHRLAKWNKVDRAAASGDQVIAEARELEDDDTPAKEGRTIGVEIGGQGVDEELGLALTGLKAGQSADYEGLITGDEPKKYSIEVTQVQERELPELDDELAENVGFESVDKFREAMLSNLRNDRRVALRRRREQAVLEQLRSRHALELPNGVVQHEAEEMVQQNAQHLASQGVDLSQIDWPKQLEEIRPHAERRVHERLLLDAIAAAEKIRLDESEFEKFLAAVAQQEGMSPMELRQRLAQTGRLEGLRGQMLREQTLRQLVGEDPVEEDPVEKNPAEEDPVEENPVEENPGEEGPDGDAATDRSEEG